MNLKSISLGAAIAATATVALSAGAPAQAAGLTGRLSIDLGGRVNNVNGTGVDLVNNAFALQAAPGSSITGSFATYSGGTVTLKDLVFPSLLTNTPTNVNLNVPAFITLAKIGQPDLTFNLTQVLSAAFFDIGLASDGLGTVTGRLRGFFQPSGIPNRDAVDSIVAFKITQSSNSGAIELTPVPTPALLPGLIGFGVAALRKRKGEATPEPEMETVEVKA